MQLFTTAHHEGTPATDAVGVWCWFDIVILENADATEPLVKDGRALVWRSHDIPKTATKGADEQAGKLFGREDEILGLLNVGSFISVHVVSLECAYQVSFFFVF